MKNIFKNILLLSKLFFLTIYLTSCGSGLEIGINLDQYTQVLSMDDNFQLLQDQLKAKGFLSANSSPFFPELWPEELPPITYKLSLKTTPLPVALIGDDNGDVKYEQLKKYKDNIRRIELNQVIIRVEYNSLNIDLPQLFLQAANKKDVSAYDKYAWFTIGSIPPVRAQELVDLPLHFAKGGYSFLSEQMSDQEKEFALRIVGDLKFTLGGENREIPRGSAKIRILAKIVFFATLP